MSGGEHWARIATVALIGCSNSGSTIATSPVDASLTEIVPADDASAPPLDAGPLWQHCSPADPASCPAGFECFPSHTAPVDAIDTCVFRCSDGGAPLCAASGGTCACALTVTGGPGDCSPGNDAGAVTVCVPEDDAGPTGNNEVEDAGEAQLTDGEVGDGSDAGSSDAGPG